MENLLRSRLEPVIRRHHWRVLGWQLAACWAAAALAALGLILAQRETGWFSPVSSALVAGLAVIASLLLILRQSSAPADYRAAALRIEQRHPELKGLLLTAVQQRIPEGQPPAYLQHRLLDQAIEHSRQRDWRDVIPRSQVWLAVGAYLAALVLFVAAFANLRGVAHQPRREWTPPWGVVVTPGDASIERGESLVVLARFGGSLPAGVTMVVRTSGETARRIPLVKSLADPVFGASIPGVDQDLTYSLEYAGKQTRDYKVSVFEHPRLERADATLTYPAYTRLAQKRIENTRRVSAVEGTRLDLALQLNKPVSSAVLVAHDAKKTVVPLQVVADKAVASLPQFPLVASQTYDLQLVDRDGRTNRLTAPFVIDVLPNRPPELHLTTPRGDVRASAIEEIHFTGNLLGEFGVSAYGLAYTLAGGETKTVELGHGVPAAEKRPFDYTLSLEDLGVRPDQLLSWYVWADDTGPDGKPRRTNGDLYFGEIRPFDEIFRESKGMDSPDDAGGGGNQGGDGQRLTELEKQIVTATWKLQRAPSDPKYADDVGVVRDSQQQALTQASDGEKKADDPRTKAYWTAATQQMQQALTHLGEAPKAATALAPALAAEQSAYQALLRLQARQTLVSRGQRGRGGQGGANQKQIDQLDLTQEQNRYETQRQASAAETPQRREQLQVMNRLQELARRQQDVNDRLKEMQTALQEAKTEQAREEIRRQLKRLQDEQQQMVADVDELQQRMDRQENQSTMNDQRRQLDQTRSDVQRAADAAGQGSVPEALAAGTRAQRQLQDMHDQLHKQNSSEFADDLRDMRAQARTLAENEEAVGQKLNGIETGAERKSLTDTAGADSPVTALDRQKQRMTDLVNRTKQVSQQAESSEPLLAEKLYDSLRKLTQDDTGTVKEFQQELLNSGLMTRGLNDHLNDQTAAEGTKSLDLTSELLKEGYQAQAGQAERRARAGIDEFKNGLESAAESVIGDDAEALRLARSELDSVTNELQREAAPPLDPSHEQDLAKEALTQAEAAVRAHPEDQQARENLANLLEGAGRKAEAEAQRRQLAQGGARGQNSPNSPSGQPESPGSGQAQTASADNQPAGAGQGQRGSGRNPENNSSNPPSGQSSGQSATASAGSPPPGSGQGQGQNGSEAAGGQNGRNPGRSTAPRLAGGPPGGAGGQGGDPLALDNLIGGGGGGGRTAPVGAGPITGGDYGSWADRLRDVEEIVDSPDLRNAVATARERARLLRQDYRNTSKRPDWAVVEREVVKPLVEVRNHINDELARRGSKDSLVPIDRDPVPDRYAASVQKYYEDLGKDK